MNFEVIPTAHFEKKLKKLSKKYPNIKYDIRDFAGDIETNLKLADPLGKDCYKVRIQITGKHAGKSGGGRIILQAKLIAQKIYLLTIYDKGDQSTITEKEIDLLISQIK